MDILELLLNHRGDPTLLASPSNSSPQSSPRRSAVALAARRGRADLLALFERRGVAIELSGVDRLIAACAKDDAAMVRSLAGREPETVRELRAEGGKLLAEFAGNGNTQGVRHLLDLGVEAGAVFQEGDGYWDVAKNSTALHVAAWRARPATVRFLIERGASIDLPDGKGRTPLMLAVKACVDSYWTERRSPESVEALLRAGASTRGVAFPCGYTEVDELLRLHRE
jgi:ankyrin repeat protein